MSEEIFDDLVIVTDEDGVSHKFELIDAIETDESRYVALIPFSEEDEESDEDDELIILEVVNENGDDMLIPIEDEADFNFVAGEFEKRLSEMFDINLE